MRYLLWMGISFLSFTPATNAQDTVKQYGNSGMHITQTGVSDGGRSDAGHPQVKDYGTSTLHLKKAPPNAPFVYSGQNSQVKEYGAAAQSGGKSSWADSSTNLGAYLTDIEAKVNPQAPQKFLGQVVINFHVAKDGALSNLKVVRSSGMPQIDTIATDAIKKAAPFAPIASGSPKDIQYTFEGNSAGTRSHAVLIPK